MDKLQFLSFIFAVLLSIVQFIALRPWSTIMHQHTKIMLTSMQMFLRYHDFSNFLYGD